MELGIRIRELRQSMGASQGQLSLAADLSQAYLSQIENGDVKNPSAAVLLRLAEAMHVDPDELFEAAGYPSVRTLRRSYEGYEAQVDPDLLRYLGNLSRDHQRRLLYLLEGLGNVVENAAQSARREQKNEI
jgi:transcriptional regulator with XRE-family HTH domain